MGPPLLEPPRPTGANAGSEGSDATRRRLGYVNLARSGRSLFWNSWMSLETDPPSVKPARALEPDRTYRLHLDLAGFDYRAALRGEDASADGVAPVKASAKVTELVTADRGSALIEIVILPDENIFQRHDGDLWSADMQVDIGRVLNYHGETAGSPFVHPDLEQPPFRFAHKSFRLSTKRIDKPTTASIGISMWANHRPVQELELLVCVDPSGLIGPGHCQLPLFIGDPAGGGLVEALGRYDVPPEAALHILRLGDARLVSLLRRGDEPLNSALKWRVTPGDDQGFLRSHVTRLAQINKANDRDLPILGGYLLDDLFEFASDDVQEIQTGFRAFFSERLAQPLSNGRRRTIAFRAKFDDFVPLGLAAVPVGATHVFFGQQFAMEFPLQAHRGVAPSESCALPWISVLPPGAGQKEGAQDGTLLAARAQLATRASTLLRRWETPSDCTFTDMIQFRDWANHPRAVAHRTGLFVLSHHDAAKTTMFFSPKQDDLLAPIDFKRTFAPGSVAVLNACGTGNPAAFGFISALNARGIDTIIATATEVKAEMAADFSYCLALQIETKKEAVPIGDAFDQAVECLATLDNGKYGARAFTYTLLGDRSLPTCAPPLHGPSCAKEEP